MRFYFILLLAVVGFLTLTQTQSVVDVAFVIGIVVGSDFLYKHYPAKKSSKPKKINSKQLAYWMKKYEEENGSIVAFLTDNFWQNNKFSSEYVKNRVVDIENEEQFMIFADKLFRNKKPLDLIFFTDGGSIQTSDTIFKVLLKYTKPKRYHIPYYSYSAGTMVALTGDVLHMNKYSFLGPVDPQIDHGEESYSSAIFLKLLQKKNENLGDETLIQCLDAETFHKDNIENVKYIVKNKIKTDKQTDKAIEELCSGKYPHHKQFFRSDLRKMGLKVNGVKSKMNKLFKQFIKLKKKFEDENTTTN